MPAQSASPVTTSSSSSPCTDERFGPPLHGGGLRRKPSPGPLDGTKDPAVTKSESVVDDDIKPTGRGAGTLVKFAKPTHGGGAGNGISYHGGPVVTGTPNIYFIWYGNWSGNSATSILTD